MHWQDRLWEPSAWLLGEKQLQELEFLLSSDVCGYIAGKILHIVGVSEELAGNLGGPFDFYVREGHWALLRSSAFSFWEWAWKQA